MFNIITQHFEENDRRIFWTVIWSIGLCVSLYIYFLGSSVYSVIARKQAETDISQLTSRISQLESEYVNLNKKISLELAHRSGFVDVTVPKYVSITSARDSFTLRESPLR